MGGESVDTISGKTRQNIWLTACDFIFWWQNPGWDRELSPTFACTIISEQSLIPLSASGTRQELLVLCTHSITYGCVELRGDAGNVS